MIQSHVEVIFRSFKSNKLPKIRFLVAQPLRVSIWDWCCWTIKRHISSRISSVTSYENETDPYTLEGSPRQVLSIFFQLKICFVAKNPTSELCFTIEKHVKFFIVVSVGFSILISFAELWISFSVVHSLFSWFESFSIRAFIAVTLSLPSSHTILCSFFLAWLSKGWIMVNGLWDN